MNEKESLKILVTSLKHFHVLSPGEEKAIKSIEAALNRLEYLELKQVSVKVVGVGTGARMSGKQYYNIDMAQRLFNLEKCLEIVKEIGKSFNLTFYRNSPKISFQIQGRNQYLLQEITFKDEWEYFLLKEYLE